MWGVCVVVVVVACTAATPAAAQSRAFVLIGDKSPFRSAPQTGSVVASDVSRPVVDIASMPGDRVAVLTRSRSIDVVDERGLVSPLAQIPAGELAEGQAVDVEASGALLAVVGGRVWRVDPTGRASVLTAEVLTPVNMPAVNAVRDVKSLPDGGFLFTQDLTVRRSLPDRRQVLVAGSGAEGEARAGPALRSPLMQAERVVALPDGGFAFSDFGAMWRVGADGVMRHVPGCEHSARSLDVAELLALPDGRLAISCNDGLYEEHGRRLRRIIPAGEFTAPPDLPPLWAGRDARHAWLASGGPVARSAQGEWLIGLEDGVALLTRGATARRLAVAVHSDTLASVWRARVRVSATRPALVRLRGRSPARGGSAPSSWSRRP